jgi:hypothetical protein
MLDVRCSTFNLFAVFNPGPAIEVAGLIIKKTVPFWRCFIQGVNSEEREPA